MALRPFITAGVAFATAGVVAATVAIAPPMSPGDLKVAKDTDVALNALITDPNLVPLINAYFSQPPDGIVTGATGVAQQLLLRANEGDGIAQALINTYVIGGADALAQLLLVAVNPDAGSVEQINTYFDGGLSELARLRLLWSTNDPTQRAWINRYFGEFVNDDGSDNIAQNGAQGVVWRFLADRGLSPQQRAILDTFWNAPTAYNSQAVPVLDPETEEPVLDENGEPVFVGNSNPARRGSFGVLYNQIKGSGLSPSQQVALDEYWDGGAERVVRNTLLRSTGDPTQRLDIVSFFDGGISENFRWRLIAGANGDANSINLTNEFFDNGITGVVRYLLVGPVPETPEPEPEANALRVANVEESTEDVTPDANPAPLAGKSAPVQAVAASVPEAAPAPAPAAEPAAEPASTKVKEAATEDETATDLKSGNKVEPVIILPGGAAAGGSRGGGAWGWNGLADRVNGFVKGVQNATGGGAPAAADPADSGDTGDSGEGGE